MRQFLRRVWRRKWWICRVVRVSMDVRWVCACLFLFLLCLVWSRLWIWCVWIFRRTLFLIVKLLSLEPFLYQESVTPALRRIARQSIHIEEPPVQAVRERSGTDPRSKVRLSKQFQNRWGAERCLHQKGRHCSRLSPPTDPPAEVDGGGRHEPSRECTGTNARHQNEMWLAENWRTPGGNQRAGVFSCSVLEMKIQVRRLKGGVRPFRV